MTKPLTTALTTAGAPLLRCRTIDSGLLPWYLYVPLGSPLVQPLVQPVAQPLAMPWRSLAMPLAMPLADPLTLVCSFLSLKPPSAGPSSRSSTTNPFVRPWPRRRPADGEVPLFRAPPARRAIHTGSWDPFPSLLSPSTRIFVVAGFLPSILLRLGHSPSPVRCSGTSSRPPVVSSSRLLVARSAPRRLFARSADAPRSADVPRPPALPRWQRLAGWPCSGSGCVRARTLVQPPHGLKSRGSQLLPGISGPQAGAIDPQPTRYYRRRLGQGGGAHHQRQGGPTASLCESGPGRGVVRLRESCVCESARL